VDANGCYDVSVRARCDGALPAERIPDGEQALGIELALIGSGHRVLLDHPVQPIRHVLRRDRRAVAGNHHEPVRRHQIEPLWVGRGCGGDAIAPRDDGMLEGLAVERAQRGWLNYCVRAPRPGAAIHRRGGERTVHRIVAQCGERLPAAVRGRGTAAGRRTRTARRAARTAAGRRTPGAASGIALASAAPRT